MSDKRTILLEMKPKHGELPGCDRILNALCSGDDSDLPFPMRAATVLVISEYNNDKKRFIVSEQTRAEITDLITTALKAQPIKTRRLLFKWKDELEEFDRSGKEPTRTSRAAQGPMEGRLPF